MVLLLFVASSQAVQPSREVPAKEILDKIEAGQPVEYDNVTILGDLNLSRLELPTVHVERTEYEKYFLGLRDDSKVIASAISITNSLIMGSIDSKGVTLQKNVDLMNTEILNDTYFSGARFNQSADFSDTRFNQSAYFRGSIFNQSDNFWGSRFNQSAYFRGSRFNQSAYFSDTRFNQSANFGGSRFNQSAYFRGSRFNQFADFSDTRFNQSAYFIDTRFNQSANFGGSRFNQSAYFRGSRFNQSAYFRGSRFNQSAYFIDTRFNQFADFSDTRFNQSADFSGSRFNQSAYFSDSRFNQSAYFRGSRFNQSADFSGSRFNQFAYFSDTRFNQSADFRHSVFNQESYFQDVHFLYANFDDSQFSKEAFFDGSKFNGTLSLYRTKYDKLNIRWSSIHDLAYYDTDYYLLIENFKKQGFTDDANECYYSYRCKHGWELLRQGKIFNWFFDSLAWGTYGYGLQPWQPLGWSICIIFLGGFFFWHSKGILRKEGDDKDVSIWEALLLSATYYTSGASAIISSTPMEFTPQGKARYVVILLRLSGWIFFVLFLSSLTRIV